MSNWNRPIDEAIRRQAKIIARNVANGSCQGPELEDAIFTLAMRAVQHSQTNAKPPLSYASLATHLDTTERR